MAVEKYGFFDSTANDERAYAEADWVRFARLVGRDGVRDLQSLAVTAGKTGLTVQVGYGSAMIDGRHYELYDDGGSIRTLTLSAPSAAERIDRVVLRLNYAQRTVLLAIKSGTEGGGAPALTRNATQYEISLAQVRLPVGAGSITQANITDERADGSVCGLVRPGGMMIERSRTQVSVPATDWTCNAQGVWEKTVNVAGTSAESAGQRVDIAVTGDQIGRVLLCGGRVNQSGTLTLSCLAEPNVSFTLDVSIVETV